MIRTNEQKDKGKLTVTIDPKFAFRVKGRIVDQRGKPVSNVPVTIWWTRLLVSEKSMKGTGIGSALDMVKTDPDGRFVSQALWPGDSYKVSVESRIFAKAETPDIKGTAGETHDFGTISLVETSAHVAGRVVGSDGKPIAGAQVFNRGDSPRPVSTQTGPDGRFLLDGLYSGSRYAFARRDGYRFGRLADALKTAQTRFLFVRKDGYRFTGMAVVGDADDLTVKLLKQDEPPDGWKPREAVSYEEQRAFAKQIMIRLWDKYGQNAAKNGAWALVEPMASIDPELALRWSTELGNRFDDSVVTGKARGLAETDAPAAVKLLAQDDGNNAGFHLQQLAGEFLPIDHDKAWLFAQEAALRARSCDQQARAGAVLVQVGKPEAGRKLIEDAAKTASTLGTVGQDGYARGIVARALAPIDLERALALIEPIKERRDKDRYTGFIVEGIAAALPDRALALVASLDSSTSLPQTLKTEVAYAIAPTQPDKAVTIVDGMTEGQGSLKHQAEALGWLAVAIAPRDRSRACKLIDRALALPIDRPQEFGSYVYFGGALASSAGIALNARRIGYPDMNAVLMQVMAARPDGQTGFSDPAMQTLSATIAAPLVALLDPAAAEIILGQIEVRSGLSPAELASIAGENWLAAWALVDLKQAEALVEADLSALQTRPEARTVHIGFLRMIDALLRPPSRREESLRQNVGASWRPGSWD